MLIFDMAYALNENLCFVKDKSRKTQLPAPPAPEKGLAIPTVIFGSQKCIEIRKAF